MLTRSLFRFGPLVLAGPGSWIDLDHCGPLAGPEPCALQVLLPSELEGAGCSTRPRGRLSLDPGGFRDSEVSLSSLPAASTGDRATG